MSAQSKHASEPNSTRSISRLLVDIRGGNSEAVGDLLQLYRAYLTVLAESQLSERMRRRVNPSDIVQESMLAAVRDFQSSRGFSERELLGWLRQILVNCVRQTVDVHLNAQKRDMRREFAVHSSDRTGSYLNGRLALVSDVSSPSSACQKRELAARVANQLAKLRPDYRDVIVYRNLQGRSFAEIAERMNREVGTVRMLWLRAMAKFKDVCEPVE